MNVIKRNGKEVPFDADKIILAISKANKDYQTLSPDQINDITNRIIANCNKLKRSIGVEEIQDMVENGLIKANAYEVVKHYIQYRYQKALDRNQHTTDGQILSTVDLENEEVKQENSNKNPTLLSTQRDYVAGTVSRDIAERKLLPEKIVDAHKKGIIHFHDSDYFIHHMHNCSLINIEDMLQNGAVINGTTIEKPHSFMTACTVTTQIMALVASHQYGGQTVTLTHLAPFVDISRQRIKSEIQEELILADTYWDEQTISKVVEKRLREEVRKGAQTIQYQILTISSTNGQSPFVSLCMYLGEAKEPQLKADLAMIIEEVLRQRIKGVKNEAGVWSAPTFPKLLYILEEDNITEDSPYWYLTRLAAECTTKRMVPDYISEKVMKQWKDGDCFPCMGAARGDEVVTIKVNEEIFENIPIKTAYQIIKLHTCDQNYSSQPDMLSNYIEKQVGVYKITHKPTGFYYVGSSKDLARRRREYNYNIKRKGCLGEFYKLNDFDLENYSFDVVELCDVNNLYQVECKWVDLKDPLCINQKDSSINGNPTFENKSTALAEQRCGAPGDKKSYTWFRKITDSKVFIKSHGEWQPVRAITYNNADSPLYMYAISYLKGDQTVVLHVTEDHPLFIVNKGRTEARNIRKDDLIVDCNTGEYYPVISAIVTEEHCESFDFEVDNDMFDLSGIMSYNCRSFLNTSPDHKYYGRFNKGVVTINLVDVACSSKKDFNKFWQIFDERLELCHQALLCRYERLKGTPSDVAPILWQHGALARLKPGETIDKLLVGGYSTISLGYAGLWEMVYYMTGKKLTESEGLELGLKIMQYMHDKCDEWNKSLNLGFSLYGTPIESTTYKFAKCLQERFGIIKGVTDKNYITNSYHIHVTEPIDAFSKLETESAFQMLSSGGAISYVEVPDLSNNVDAALAVIKFIYEHIPYAELNCKFDYCLNPDCLYEGEMRTVQDENNKLLWECPCCGNRDPKKLQIVRRVCGYLSSNTFNQGRHQEIYNRYIHLG